MPETSPVATLAAGLWGELSRTPGNVTVSPYSVAVALALTAAGARGATQEEMLAVLGVDDQAVLDRELPALTRRVEACAGPEDVLATANALFGQASIAWEQDLVARLGQRYGAGLRTVDFWGDTEGARTEINRWTAHRTHERIPDLVPADALDTTTRLVLVNALYLKAAWQSRFEPADTHDRSFHLDDSTTVQVPTMRSRDAASLLGRGEGWQACQLGYAGGGLAMTVLLPDPGCLSDLERAIADGGLPSILGSMERSPVDLSLPRWTCRAHTAMTEPLVALGMRTAFDEDAADFSALSPEAGLYVKTVLHEVFVAVDETGTEAAAATAVVVGVTSLPPEATPFAVDRPFLFVIHDVEHGTPLFLGRVSDPTHEPA